MMEDFKLEYTEPDQVYETVDTIKEPPQYRFYEVEVSRQQLAWFVVRLPYDKPLTFKNCNLVTESANDILDESDWESDDFCDISMENFREITEEYANQFDICELE